MSGTVVGRGEMYVPPGPQCTVVFRLSSRLFDSAISQHSLATPCVPGTAQGLWSVSETDEVPALLELWAYGEAGTVAVNIYIYQVVVDVIKGDKAG